MVKIIIRNFQSIVEAKIAAEGFTLLVGPSSAGKSACLRAIQAALTNRFRSGQVREENGVPVGNAEISILFPDSTPLKVIKSPEGSPSMSFEGQVYSKLSRTVPLPISSAVNMSPLQDSYSLNFHPQFEKPLLLEFSQRKVLDLLSTSSALSDLHLVKDHLLIKRSENRGAFNSISSILDSLNVQHTELASKVETLTPLVNSLQSKSTLRDSLISQLDSLAELQSLVSSHLDERISKLLRLVSLVESLSDPTFTSLLKLRSLTSESYDEPISKLTVKVQLLEKISNLQSKTRDVDNTLTKIRSLSQSLESRVVLTKMIDQQSHVVNDNICPICGAPLSSHRIESHD